MEAFLTVWVNIVMADLVVALDNAAAIATLADVLKSERASRAARWMGIFGAIVARALMFAMLWLLLLVHFVEFLAGVYLIVFGLNHLEEELRKRLRGEEHPQGSVSRFFSWLFKRPVFIRLMEPVAGPFGRLQAAVEHRTLDAAMGLLKVDARVRPKVNRWLPRKWRRPTPAPPREGMAQFLAVVRRIIFMDMVMGLDNVIIVRAFTDNYLWIALGVGFSMLVMLPAAAGYKKLIRWEPLAGAAAFLVMAVIGVEVCLGYYGHHTDNLTKLIVSSIVIFGSIGFVKVLRGLRVLPRLKG